MRTVEEITRDINLAGILRQPEKIPDILREWAHEIIEECQSKFMWEWNCADEHDAVMIVDKDTVDEVKMQIQ